MQSVSLIVFLQNAHSAVYAGAYWPRASWLRALARSRSGQRLKLMIDDLSVCHNTTPRVASRASQLLPPDVEHVSMLLSAYDPALVVACGRSAERTLSALFAGHLLCVPHPAHRLLTDALYVEARELIARWEITAPACRLALRQERAGTKLVELARFF
jgi:hypothetical protein